MSKSLIYCSTHRKGARFRGVGGLNNPVIFLPLAWDPYPPPARRATAVKITAVITAMTTPRRGASTEVKITAVITVVTTIMQLKKS